MSTIKTDDSKYMDFDSNDFIDSFTGNMNFRTNPISEVAIEQKILCYILDRDDECIGVSTLDSYLWYLREMDKRPKLYNIKIDNEVNNTIEVFDVYGNLVDSYGLSEVQRRQSYNINEPIDYFNGLNILSELNKRGYLMPGNLNNRLVNCEGIFLLRTNPAKYKKKFILKEQIPLNELERKSKLIKLLLLEPGQFEEEFSIIKSEPSSFKMKTYLHNLANLVSKEMELADEIEDIDILKLKAYQKADFKESMEEVEEKALEFEDYFKYCLIKDEKQIITQEEYNNIKAIVDSIKQSVQYKKIFDHGKVSINKDFNLPSVKNKELKLTIDSKADFYYKSNGLKAHTTTTILITDKSIMDFPSLKDDLELSIQIAVLNESLKHKFAYDISKKWHILHSVLVIDKDHNVCNFYLKDETLKQCNDKLDQNLEKVSWHFNKNKYELPWELLNESLSI